MRGYGRRQVTARWLDRKPLTGSQYHVGPFTVAVCVVARDGSVISRSGPAGPGSVLVAAGVWSGGRGSSGPWGFAGDAAEFIDRCGLAAGGAGAPQRAGHYPGGQQVQPVEEPGDLVGGAQRHRGSADLVPV